MKVLLAAHQFLPEYSAGTEVLTAETARELQARGHEVSVFAGHPYRGSCEDHERFESYSFEGIEVTRFRHSHSPMGGVSNVMALEYDNPLLAEFFRKHLERTRPDVVHFFHLQRLSASALATCQSLRIPTVLTVTDFWPLCPTNQLMLPDNSHCPGPSADGANCLRHIAWLRLPAPLRWLVTLAPRPLWSLVVRLARSGMAPDLLAVAQVRSLADRPGFIRNTIAGADRIFVATRFMARAVESLGVDARKVSVQPFGIRYTARTAARAPDEGPLRIGFVGTLYEHKGAHVLVEALRSIPHTLSVTAGFYGDTAQFPAYFTVLQRLANGDPRIEFRGTFPQRDIAEVMEGLDVLVAPSLWHENSPLVLLHAQAAGCPVVGSNVAGISELVHDGENGLLFAPGDAPALARALVRLAEDRSLLRQLGSRAMRVKQMTEYADELIRTYRELANLSEGRT
jgi:glycosyltransferase involved in cell wall biosynthesis